MVEESSNSIEHRALLLLRDLFAPKGNEVNRMLYSIVMAGLLGKHSELLDWETLLSEAKQEILDNQWEI